VGDSLIANKFNSWLVVGVADKVHSNIKYNCVCDCGTEKSVYKSHLTSNASKSCGCISNKKGEASAKSYNRWIMMKKRCYDTSSKDYSNYGGRGIKVCDRWLDFKLYYKDVGESPDGMTLDRYPDNNGDYEPSNWRWASRSEQCYNRRRWGKIDISGIHLRSSGN